MKRGTVKLMAVGLAGLACVTFADTGSYDESEYGDKNYSIQALLGGVRFDDLVLQSSSGTNSAAIDMATIPQLGGAWSTKPKGEKIQYGLEASFLLGFRIDDVTYAVHNGTAYVNVSSSMWMFDFAGGGYANVALGKKARLYGAAGPLMIYSSFSSDQDFTDNTPNTSVSESAFGFGVYARTGLEFQVHPHAYLGAGLRWNWASVDFSDVGGETDLSGIGAFITYTAGL